MAYSLLSSEQKEIYLLQELDKIAGDVKDIGEVIVVLQEVLKLFPTSIELRSLLRTIEIERFEESSKLGYRLSTLKVQVLLIKGSQALPNEPDKALALAEEILALNPYHEKANELLAKAALSLNFLKVAEFAYETIAQSKPDDVNGLHRLAEIYVKSQDFCEAISVYQQILNLTPHDFDAREGMAHAKRCLTFEKDVNANLQANPLTPLSEDWGRNLPKNQKVKTQKIGDPNYHRKTPDVEALTAQLQFWDQKIEALREEFEQNPDVETELNETILHRAGIYLTGVEQQASLYPDDSELQFEFGEALAAVGRYPEALKALESALHDQSLKWLCFSRMAQYIVKRMLQEKLHTTVSLLE